MTRRSSPPSRPPCPPKQVATRRLFISELDQLGRLAFHENGPADAARPGEAGWLSGGEAQATACAAHMSPVVTGTPDWDVVSAMADVFLDAHGIEHGLTRQARLALERTLLRMAIDALSGPGGLAGFLRASLLSRPFSGASLPLDLGDSDHIPGYPRRAVILRDAHCQWPGGCDRPASHCEPHHLVPRSEGGETSLRNLALYCPPSPLHPPPRVEDHRPSGRHHHRDLTPGQDDPQP